MGRKRRKVVVTVTETWTFVFDAAGEMPLPASLSDPPTLASLPTAPLDDLPPTDNAFAAPAADAHASGSESEQGA